MGYIWRWAFHLPVIYKRSSRLTISQLHECIEFWINENRYSRPKLKRRPRPRRIVHVYETVRANVGNGIHKWNRDTWHEECIQLELHTVSDQTWSDGYQDMVNKRTKQNESHEPFAIARVSLNTIRNNDDDDNNNYNDINININIKHENHCLSSKTQPTRPDHTILVIRFDRTTEWAARHLFYTDVVDSKIWICENRKTKDSQ